MNFKNSTGRWLTKALFFELTPAMRPHAVFTLKDEDHVALGVTYISLKRLFLECDDPTEYAFATEHLGGWNHWKELQQADDLVSHVEDWRDERDVRLQSIGVRKMVESAEMGNYQAAKCLMDKGWILKEKGRPSKEAVKKEAKAQARLKLVANEDMKRIRGIHD